MVDPRPNLISWKVKKKLKYSQPLFIRNPFIRKTHYLDRKPYDRMKAVKILLIQWEGVQSNFWIHVSQTREGFNPPLRLSLRRGSNSNQTRNRGYGGMNCPPSSDWRWILVCPTVWVADLTSHLYGWHESKNWIVLYLYPVLFQISGHSLSRKDLQSPKSCA